MKIWLHNENGGCLERNFYPVIDLREFTHIQLLSCDLHNSWYNVTSENNTLKFRPGNKEGLKTMKIKSGNYNIHSLNEAINRNSNLGGKKILFEKHKPTGKVRLNVPNDFEIMFKEGKNFAALLGFDEEKATAGKYGEKRANFLTVKKYIVHCDAVDRADNYADSGCMNLRPADYLQILPVRDTTDICEQVFYDFSNPVKMPLKKTSYLSSIKIWFTDQNGQDIDFNGFPVSVCVELI